MIPNNCDAGWVGSGERDDDVYREVQMETIRRMYKCKECDSTDLLFDARATWNGTEQRFELSEVFPGEWTYCNSCEDIVDVKEVEI